MEKSQLGPETDPTIERLLGYLNFSSGAPDPQFHSGIDELYRLIRRPESPGRARKTAPQTGPTPPPTWRRVIGALQAKLRSLQESSEAFKNVEQAAAALRLLEEHYVRDYFEFHRDLLFHQNENHLIGPFMLGRLCEALLESGMTPAEMLASPAETSQAAIGRVNDYLGHRPVATLESHKVAPRQHEWVRPVPLYIAGAGVASCAYQELIERAVELLKSTDDDLMDAAYFSQEAMTELAFDPRAYDFDHPANKRPNYHFGEWDPHCIDSKGQYRRFVVREVTLKAMLDRVSQAGKLRIPREQLMFEAGAVLAGTILMASGISGSGPDTHDSNTTLLTLIPRIATYRDVFYERLIDRLEDDHAERLVAEAEKLRQPFGGARQHLNAYLSRQRSLQIEHAKLAKVFARMGYLGAAQRQADSIQVAASRMACRIDCAVTAARQALAVHDRQTAMRQLERIVDLIHRGIDCGAIVDPWNILGFDANFSLFPALENTVHDRRIDDLIDIIGRLFDLFARLWSDAAAADDHETSERVAVQFERVTDWWNKFAAHEVSSVESPSPRVEFDAARDVAAALRDWHRRGAASGDVAFWAPHVESFGSPKAYALVVETLLSREDFVSSMSLLIHWLGKAPEVALETSEASFQDLATQWVHAVIRHAEHDDTQQTSQNDNRNSGDWRLLRKFFDYVEANANEYWNVPTYDRLDGDSAAGDNAEDFDDPLDDPLDDDDDEDQEGGLFRAAYEDVVYRDSTDDGVDGAIFDTDSATNTELEHRSLQIVDRLTFLSALAKLWTLAAASLGSAKSTGGAALETLDDYRETLRGWYRSCSQMRRGLMRLVETISEEQIAQPDGDHESMIEYDRQRLLKETMIENAIATAVEASEAERFLLAALWVFDDKFEGGHTSEAAIEGELTEASRLLSAVMRQDTEATSALCKELLANLPELQILYVPLAKAGRATNIALARMRQRIIENLLVALPRMGLIASTVQLLDATRQMERNVPVGRGAVTQFDELFKVGFREMVDALVRATSASAGYLEQDERDADSVLVQCLERLTEPALETWLMHSRTLRLSVVEGVRQPPAWKKLVDFIQNYGDDLFTQRFLALGNIRAILHCGADHWLTEIARSGRAQLKLLDAIEEGLPQEEAAAQLNLILEAIVENYDEYRDYNTTTTQSDRGELLYMLLDFVRLRIEYDRVAWNLRPVVWAHEVMVRRGRNAGAQLWRRMLADRIGEEATRYQRRLTRLQKKYAIRMTSVASRIGERFLLPMTIDRMLALVKPAVEQSGQPDSTHAFEILEEETGLLMREPAGAGTDGAEWLWALEQEVERVNYSGDLSAWPGNELLIRPIQPELDDVESQLQQMSRRQAE